MKDMTHVVKSALAELVGTFFLTLAALISGTPYVVGLTLGIFVYTIGALSGCNLNPAVSLGLMVTKRLPIPTGLIYIAVQIAGAGLALLAATFTGHLASHYTAASPLAEFLGFGLLMLTVIAVTDKNVPQAGSGIAIGAALAAGLVISRGVLNPAVAIAMGLVLSPATWATLLSGICFSLFYTLYKPTEKTAEKENESQQPVSFDQIRSVPRAK